MQQPIPHEDAQLELDFSEAALIDDLIESPADVHALLIVAHDQDA